MVAEHVTNLNFMVERKMRIKPNKQTDICHIRSFFIYWHVTKVIFRGSDRHTYAAHIGIIYQIFLRQVPMFANWGTIMFVISAVPLTKLVEVNNKYFIYIIG